jgi:hypothetical protein
MATARPGVDLEKELNCSVRSYIISDMGGGYLFRERAWQTG